MKHKLCLVMQVISNTDIVYSSGDKDAGEVRTHSCKSPLWLSGRECMLLGHSLGFWESASSTAYCSKLQKNDKHPSRSLCVCVCTHVHRNTNAVSLKLVEILVWVPHISRTDFFFLGIEAHTVWKQKDHNEGSSSASTVGWLWPQTRYESLNSDTITFWENINPLLRARTISPPFPKSI